MNKNILNQLLGMFSSSKGKFNEFDILKSLLSSFSVPKDSIRNMQTPKWADVGFSPREKNWCDTDAGFVPQEHWNVKFPNSPKNFKGF